MTPTAVKAISPCGGSLAAAEGPLFYVTNTTGFITISGVRLSSASGVLIESAAGRWGRKGANGGNAVFTADRQTLQGNFIVADGTSSISATLKNGTTLTGAVQGASLTLDASSKWNVQADSTVAALTNEAGLSGATISNVIGNSHTVTYDAKNSQNAWLAGKTYAPGGRRATRAENVVLR